MFAESSGYSSRIVRRSLPYARHAVHCNFPCRSRVLWPAAQFFANDDPLHGRIHDEGARGNPGAKSHNEHRARPQMEQPRHAAEHPLQSHVVRTRRRLYFAADMGLPNCETAIEEFIPSPTYKSGHAPAVLLWRPSTMTFPERPAHSQPEDRPSPSRPRAKTSRPSRARDQTMGASA